MKGGGVTGGGEEWGASLVSIPVSASGGPPLLATPAETRVSPSSKAVASADEGCSVIVLHVRDVMVSEGGVCDE